MRLSRIGVENAQNPLYNEDRMTEHDEISAVEAEIKEAVNRLACTFGGSTVCYPLLSADEQITAATVDRVFDDLQEMAELDKDESRLAVIVDSRGGDIDAAYNLARLFRRYGKGRLTYIVPRRAKSAATLLVCGGDSVMMTPVAELGPLDPQITMMNPLERRLEDLSPLHIESTFALIRGEFEEGSKELAHGLLQRLQFPLTLGGFIKSLELGKQYTEKLLSSRMLKDDPQTAGEISRRLVEGYSAHSFCINIDEVRELGLTLEDMSSDQLEIVWKIHKMGRLRIDLISEERQPDSESDPPRDAENEEPNDVLDSAIGSESHD